MRLALTVVTLLGLAVANKVEDCGLTPDISVWDSSSITPDPTIVPGTMTLAFKGHIKQDYPEDLVLGITVIKEDPYDIKIPCLNGLGSCDVTMCDYITKYPDAICKWFPPDVPCTCKLLAGEYTAAGINITLPDLGVAVDKVISGGYHGNVTLKSKADNKMYGCIKFEFQLKYVKPPV